MENKEVKVRIAPSPTGHLHVGTARSALFNWFFAQKNKGKFILRIDDTDKERSNKDFEDNIKDGLTWLGIKPDETYNQSKRREIYKKYLEKLLEEKKAFWCYHTKEELEEEKKKQMKGKEAPRHVCSYKHEGPKEKKDGVIRLAVDENSEEVIHFQDIIRGDISFEMRTLGDMSIAKSLDEPLYNFTSIVDDHEMGITHVIRGEDHIPNTPKQILIARALGFDLPQFAHLPLLLGEDRSKLSKRHGAVSVLEYRDKGYLSEAIINFLALLGWSPSKDQDGEIFSVKEIIDDFKLERINKSGAIFDVEKLNWLNGEYIKKMSKDKFVDYVGNYIKDKYGADNKMINDIKHLLQERIKKYEDLNEFSFFFGEPEYKKELLIWKKGSEKDALDVLEKIRVILDSKIEWEIFDEEYIKNELDSLANQSFSNDRGMVYWPLRVALSGLEFSPDPIEIMKILGREEVLSRVSKAIELIRQ